MYAPQHNFAVSSRRPAFLKQLLLGLVLVSGCALAQEQWQLDQMAGEYWYVGEGYVFTHDPKENNPGTLIVVPLQDGRVAIRIFPDLEFDEETGAPVTYTFKEGLGGTDTASEIWSVGRLEDGYRYLDTSSTFVSKFARHALDNGFVEFEITDRFGKVAHRSFFLDGYTQAAIDLKSVPILQETTGNLLGQWRDDAWGVGTRVQLTEHRGLFMITYHFPDDSVFESELTEISQSDGRRFNQNDDPTEWYVLTDNGSLEIRNIRGIIRTLTP